MKFILRALLILVTVGNRLGAQKIQELTVGVKTSIRGLSVVDDNVVWVSGSNGMVGRSADSGKTWKWVTVKGFEKSDFRDIEAFDGASAIIMSVAEPAYILKTTDGGVSWKLVYQNQTPGIFLDAMEFWDEQKGIVLGDPLEGRFFIARTFDGGETWQELPFTDRPLADSGEACFAASGTNLRILGPDEACFVTGGTRSRFFSNGIPHDLPVVQGKQTTGANSIAIRDPKKTKGRRCMIVVGGDFAAATVSEKNCFLSVDGGENWRTPATSPYGYRSCVEFISRTKIICCGASGVDISTDAGMNWNLLSKDGYQVCRKAMKGKAIFLAGENGKVGKLILNNQGKRGYSKSQVIR